MPTQWPLLSRLLDEVLALPPEERDAWLKSLRGDSAALRPKLEKLLGHESEAVARGFLETPPDFTLSGSIDGADEPVRLHAVGDEVGPWRLTGLLGVGGMAEVWRAVRADGLLDRDVALKLPLPGFSTGRMAVRFDRERRLLSGLAHPRIARLYDAGTTADGQPWLALEAIDGRPLIQWCDDEGADLAKRINLVLQVCDALQHAHGRLVVHRDIKPSNILVTTQGEVRLLDFGIAKLVRPDARLGADQLESNPTQIGGRPMTPDWASPEQIRGEEPGIATDIHAVGLLMYRLLAGQGPYESRRLSARTLEAAILEEEPKPPSTRALDRSMGRALRGDLDAIVLKALKKAPQERYATADALADDLRSHVEGLPIKARPDSRAYRAGRYVLRHRWAVAGAAIVMISLVGGTAVAVRESIQARDEAVRALAMYGFMHDLFNPNDTATPDANNRDMTVRELVAKAAKTLPTALPDAPRQRLQLMTDLGALLPLLGAPQEAGALVDANVAQSKLLFGESSVEYASALMELAVVKRFPAGDVEGFYAAADQGLRLFERIGIDDKRKLSSAYLMAGFAGTQVHHPARPADLARIERAVELRRALPQNADLANALRLLATAYGEAGQEERALTVSRDALAVARAQNGEHSTATVMSLWEAADWARVALHRAQADTLMREARGIQKELWDIDNPWNGRWSKSFFDINVYGIHRAEAQGELEASYRLLSQPQWQSSGAMVRGLIEESLMLAAARTGHIAQASRWCDTFARGVPRRTTSSNYNVTVRCASIANLLGNMAQTARLLAQARAAVQALSPDKPDSYPGPELVVGEMSLMQRRPSDAAAAFSHVLRSADATDVNPISLAWLGLALATPGDPRLLLPDGLPKALSAVQKLDSGYFVEQEAMLLEASGRAKNFAGDARGAVIDLTRSVALRESIDDVRSGLWFARALFALGRSQTASGAIAAGLQSTQRAEAVLARQPALPAQTLALVRGEPV